MNRILLTLFATLLLSAPSFAGDAAAEQKFLRNIRQLTFAGSKSGEAYFSADGKSIVFQSVREPGNPFYQIYRMDLNEGAAIRVSTGKGRTTCAFFHPKKKRILFASSHLDPDAEAKQKAEIEKLKAGPPPRYQWDFDPFLDIFESDYDGGNLVRLTDAPGYDAEGAYSPDGSKIVFCSYRDKDGDGEVYIMDSDGKNQTRLTHQPGYDGGPFFSPDGKKIVWRHFTDQAHAEVWTMDNDGGNKKQVTDLKALSWGPYWTPSMKWIIFASNFEEPSFELYAIHPDGTELQRMTYTDGFDGLPVVSPDGQKLMWTSTRADGRSQIFIADLWLPGDPAPAEEIAPEQPVLGASFATRLQNLTDAAAANNFDHEVGRLYLDAGLKPFGKFEEVDETSFVQGPSVVSFLPAAGNANTALALSAPIEFNTDSAFDSAAMIEAAARLSKETKAHSMLYLASAYPDELPNVAASAEKAIKGSIPENTPKLAALINLSGLGSIRDRRLFIRGVGTASGFRELAERLAARNPDVQFVLEDDPAAAPGLVQKPPAQIPTISFGGPKDPPRNSELADPALERAYRQRAAAAAIDCIQLLAGGAPLIYQAYDAAAATAALRPYLGTIPDYKSDAAGAKLSGVRDASPAQKAGLKAGDVIVELDGKPVKNAEDFLHALESLKVNVEVSVKIQRDGKEETLKVTPLPRH